MRTDEPSVNKHQFGERAYEPSERTRHERIARDESQSERKMLETAAGVVCTVHVSRITIIIIMCTKADAV